MELLYMYMKKFDNFIENQEITFTNNFNVTLKDGISKSEKNHKKQIHCFFLKVNMI